MKEIKCSKEYINLRLKNVFIYPINNINNIRYRSIYISNNIFEIQIIRICNLILKNIIFIYKKILSKKIINFKNNNEYTDIINNDNIDIYFLNEEEKKKVKILKNIENKKTNLKIIRKNKKVDNIKIVILENKKYEIKIDSIINNNTIIKEIKTNFTIKKEKDIKIINNIIPKTIIQTYKDTNVNNEIYNSTRSWLIFNNTYKYEFFSDLACILFIKKYYPPIVLHAFYSLIPGAFKADLFRYCYLYIKGGIYTDIDNICKINLDNIIKKNDIFITVKDRPKGTLYNAFMASSPRNPILKKCIENIVYNVKNKVYIFHPSYSNLVNRLSISGPKCLGKVVNLYLNRDLETEYQEGDHNINNFKFKLLKFTEDGKYVVYNNMIIANIKYNGFNRINDYEEFYNNREVYANIKYPDE